MLEVYEWVDSDRRLVHKIQGESMEIKAVHGYLIWLELLVEGKTLLSLFVSPHQIGRLGKYLADGKWRGGAICPQQTKPEGCDILELNDQAKYQRVLADIECYKGYVKDYEGRGWGNTDWYRKQISSLEIEALMLKGSTRLGLLFEFFSAKPRMEIEWVPDDRQAEAEKFLEAARLAYRIREPEPETKTDLTEWKHRLFEV